MKSFKFLKTRKTLEKRAELDKIKHRKSKAWTKPFLLFFRTGVQDIFRTKLTVHWQPHIGSLYICSWLQKIWIWMVYILALKFLFECPFFFNVCCCFSSKDKNWRKIQIHLTQPFFNYQLQKLQLTTAIWLCNI